MIDWKRTRDLRLEVGIDVFSEVMDLFLEEVQGTLDKLCTDEPEKLKKQIHFIKGSSLNVGFIGVADLCNEYDKLSENHISQNMIDTLKTCFEDTKDLFSRELNEKISTTKRSTAP